MLARFFKVGASCAAMVIGLELPLLAQSPRPEPAVLWFRSAEGCPDGAGFLARVGDRASLVRLAEAGDRVDFVVTISLTPEGARGRLERETEGGTVAIREVADPSCERVAEVVALNLALALDPERPATSPAPPGAAPAVVQRSDSEPAVANEPPASEPPPGRPQAPPDAPPNVAEDQGPEAAPSAESVGWRAGMQGGVLGGVSSELAGRGTVFLEMTGALGQLLPGLAVRVAAVGAVGSIETKSGVVRQSLWAGRLDVCPVSLGGPVIALQPCAAGELGQLRASLAYRDSSLWSALGAHLRGPWFFASAVAVELEVGAMFPLSRYEVSAGSTVLYRSAPAGISAVMGVSVGFW